MSPSPFSRPDLFGEDDAPPSDRPMAAPAYARQRSELAKSMGLEVQRRKR